MKPSFINKFYELPNWEPIRPTKCNSNGINYASLCSFDRKNENKVVLDSI
jgi:hypothetical protein